MAKNEQSEAETSYILEQSPVSLLHQDEKFHLLYFKPELQMFLEPLTSPLVGRC